MRARMPRLTSLTRGERQFVLALAANFLIGAILSCVILLRISPGALFGRTVGAYDLWIILSGGLGGAAALYLCRHRIGLSGLPGAVLSLLILGCLAPVIGGSLAMPVYGTMFGPFLLAVTLVASPLLALMWFANLCASHLLLADWQAERDSIFRVDLAEVEA